MTEIKIKTPANTPLRRSCVGCSWKRTLLALLDSDPDPVALCGVVRSSVAAAWRPLEKSQCPASPCETHKSVWKTGGKKQLKICRNWKTGRFGVLTDCWSPERKRRRRRMRRRQEEEEGGARASGATPGN